MMTDGYAPDPREPNPADPTERVGWVLVDFGDGSCFYGSWPIPEELRSTWAARASQIMMIESFAPVAAIFTMADRLKGRQLELLVDSEAAEGP